MFGILLSAFNSVLAFLLRQVLVKFMVMFAVFFVIQEFVQVLPGLLPNPADLNGALAGIPSGVWWFLDLCAFSSGASLVVTAMVYRFLIRRIPVIG